MLKSDNSENIYNIDLSHYHKNVCSIYNSGPVTGIRITVHSSPNFQSEIRHQKFTSWDFPGGTVVKNPPSNAGDVGSIPGQGTRSHTHAETKSSRATTKEPTSHN